MTNESNSQAQYLLSIIHEKDDVYLEAIDLKEMDGELSREDLSVSLGVS